MVETAKIATAPGLSARIEEMVAPLLADMGFEVVRVLMTGSTRPKLQIMIDPVGGGDMTADHCADASRTISALLDVEDPIGHEYVLEVSSPGIDRPLVRAGDFLRFAGHQAKLETRLPRDGQRRFVGLLAGLEDGQILLDIEGDVLRFGFDELSKAKLVLTDALIAAHQRPDGPADDQTTGDNKEGT